MSTTTDSLRPGCQPIDGALRIPVTLIEPSPLNPRKTWKAERVAAMAADLKANQQIQPIRVRPNPRATGTNGRPPYEIVVGETRWRAAPDAGLATLDAIVADCTDVQLIQLALSENTKRQDLNALEEADAFDALLRKPDGLQGYATVQDLAAAVACSPSHVYQRLKLRNLCAAGREAFLAGKIDASVALLIARMPDQAEQSRAAARIVAGFGGEPYSFRNASELLKKEFMLRLDLARFDIATAYKVAGPCSECPKRSGAAPDLFQDVTGGDMCQDARCHAAKTEEAHQALLQAARDAGRTVLQGTKARAILRDANAKPVGHYRLDAPCPDLTDSARPLHALLGQGFAGSIVVVDLGDSTPIELVPEDVARKAIKARGLLRKQTADKPAAPAPAPSPAAKAGAPLFKPKAPPPPAPAPAAGRGTNNGEGEAAKPQDLAVPKLKPVGGGEDEATLASRTRVKFGELLLVELSFALGDAGEPPLLILRLAIETLWNDAPAEEAAMLYRVMGWTLDPAATYSEDFGRRLRLADGATLAGLLLLVLASRDCADELVPAAVIHTRPAGVLAKHFGIPLDRVLRDARIAAKGAPVADATGAFVAAHGAQQPAARAEEVSDEASAPRPVTVVDPDWKFPSGAI